MKKLIALILFALVVYYLVFSNKGEVVKDKVPTQIQTEDRVLDYDIKYKDAVKEINDAVELNLEKHKSIGEIVESSQTDSESDETEPPE